MGVDENPLLEILNDTLRRGRREQGDDFLADETERALVDLPRAPARLRNDDLLRP